MDVNNKLEQLKGLAAKGKINRREFVQYAMAAGVTAAVAEKAFIS